MTDAIDTETTLEAAKAATTKAKELADAGLDDVVEVMEVFRTNPTALVGVGVAGALVGAGISWLVASKRVETKYEAILQEEILSAREHYRRMYKMNDDGTAMTPAQLLLAEHGKEAFDEAMKAVSEYEGKIDESELDEQDVAQLAKTEAKVTVREEPDGAITETVETIETRTSHVFSGGHFDLAEESKHRTEITPYVINHDEYFANEGEYEVETLTYYEGDNTLAGENDVPITDKDSIVGEDNLVKFGYGSKDQHIVYVRNDRLGTIYEVIRSPGTFAKEVAGFDEPDQPTTALQARRAMRRSEG